ncbi:unnamed protein product [Symbiodinium natans]|uniref:S-adenosyl-L-methionine-dependent methyltransferase n=1 Tax=Symbiodinium natans TaxID=878477 RepID=A0A812Q5R8_9DINO|nr:unnamed protein product [Symbiodinium natans]
MSSPGGVVLRPRAFDQFGGDEAAMRKWGMDESAALMKPDEKTGMVFAEKTALMIAYERQLESERPATERLFDDWLAKAMCDEDDNANVGKRVSDCMAVGLKAIFDPTDNIGFGFEGHVQYTAARTCLINDHLSRWLEKQKGEASGASEGSKLRKQILNLGAGLDTRPFWLETLASADSFVEVDTTPICEWKARILEKVEAKKGALSPVCKRQVVPMDFAKESVKDLPSHGVNFVETVCCWILEGLIMYLKKEEVDAMLREISDLSSPGSYLMLNFMKGSPSADPDTTHALLTEKGWEREALLYFGEPGFSYGRYPPDKPANASFGFSFYTKR